nr:hypothetical protein CFP56_22447 [Quercus suber]
MKETQFQGGGGEREEGRGRRVVVYGGISKAAVMRGVNVSEEAPSATAFEHSRHYAKERGQTECHESEATQDQAEDRQLRRYTRADRSHASPEDSICLPCR